MSYVGSVCNRCASIKQRCGGGLPCSRCERLDVACIYRGGASAAPANPARIQPKLKRVRSGCTSCKARRKKCDEVKPRCSDCRRLNLSCQWQTTATASTTYIIDSTRIQHASRDQLITTDDDGGEANEIVWDYEELPNPITLPTQTLALLPDLNELDRSLLNHYIRAVADVFNRCPVGTTNPFVEKLLPVAYSSSITLSAMLSLSGIHWRRVYPQAYTRSLVHQGRAISGLSSILSRHCTQMENVQATTTVLLLCLGEFADGGSTAWQYHLNAAWKLLKKGRSPYKPNTAHVEFLYSLFHYLDAIATISSCKRPLLKAENDQDDPDIPEESETLHSTDLALESIYGVPRGLFDFVGRMNSLAQRRSTRGDPIENARFEADAAALEVDLDIWCSKYNDSISGVPESENRKARCASEALEWAIRLRSYQIVNGYDNTHSYARMATSRILTAIAAIRNGSRVESCLLFPLVIAGASTESQEHRVMVKQRLMVMENTLGFGHITAALKLLERVWQAREASRASKEGPVVNWASVRYHEFPGIVFL